MINGLQLVAHIPLFTVTLPSNASILFNEIAELVKFDYFEAVLQSMDLDITETDPYNTRFERLGYETHNIVMNLSSIMIVLTLIFLKLIIALAVAVLGCRCRRNLLNRIRRRGKYHHRNMCMQYCCRAQISIWVL